MPRSGSITTLQNSVFSTVPGSPAWVAKASVNRVSLPQYGMSWEYEGRNAIQSEWKMTENNRRAKFYKLTRLGRGQLEKEVASWNGLSSAITRVVKLKEA